VLGIHLIFILLLNSEHVNPDIGKADMRPINRETSYVIFSFFYYNYFIIK